MEAGTSVLICGVMFGFLLSFTPADQKNITAESGQNNVTLTCRAPNNIILVEWRRADLDPQDVISFRKNYFLPVRQHPSFEGRVDLQDRQMKDGDVSLILKDVNINDTGTYECHTFMEKTKSWENISIIYLHVVPPGQTGGHTEDGGKEDGSVGLIIGLLVSAALLVAVVCFLVYRKHKQKQDSYQPPPEQHPA